MGDLYLLWPTTNGDTTAAGDFQVGPDGDLLCVDGDAETRQRVIRRFLTNPVGASPDGTTLLAPDYIFEPTYGVGLRRLMGRAVGSAVAATLRSSMLNAMLLEPAIAANPPPTVVLLAIAGGIAFVPTFYSLLTRRAVAVPQIEISPSS